MAKNKKSEIPHYELLFIVPNKFTIEELKPIVKKVSGIITDNGGKITYSEEWGNKKLAYPINHFTHGYYNLFEFDVEGEKVNQINNILKMDNDIIRHLIIVKVKRTIEEINQEKAEEKERREATKIVNISREDKRKSAKKTTKSAKSPHSKQENKQEIKVEKSSKTEKQEEKKDEKKVNLEDLDEKLDKILETNDLL